jgi:hypothetical protein
MTAACQLEFLPPGIADDADGETLRAWLATHGWQTRRQLGDGLGWSERKIRDVAELMGADIVRGQKGFKLTETLLPEDFPSAVQAAKAHMSQARINFRYGAKLLRRLHQKLSQLAA